MNVNKFHNKLEQIWFYGYLLTYFKNSSQMIVDLNSIIWLFVLLLLEAEVVLSSYKHLTLWIVSSIKRIIPILISSPRASVHLGLRWPFILLSNRVSWETVSTCFSLSMHRLCTLYRILFMMQRILFVHIMASSEETH